MIPNADEALRMLSTRIMTHLLPDLSTEYAAADGMLVGLLMNAVADDLAYGIDRRMRDIEGMSRVLEKGAGLIPDYEFVPEKPASLDLRTVNGLHDELAVRLISLHAVVEGLETPLARQIDSEIWKLLGEMARRHAITAAG